MNEPWNVLGEHTRHKKKDIVWFVFCEVCSIGKFVWTETVLEVSRGCGDRGINAWGVQSWK